VWPAQRQRASPGGAWEATVSGRTRQPLGRNLRTWVRVAALAAVAPAPGDRIRAAARAAVTKLRATADDWTRSAAEYPDGSLLRFGLRHAAAQNADRAAEIAHRFRLS
jgi:hypothetical protein